MQLEWQGFYLDGKTADRRQAVIHITPTGLQVTAKNGQTFFWSYEEIRQTQGYYAGEQVRLERGAEISEALLISDEAFLVSLHRLAPGLTRHFHDPTRRSTRALLTFFAALAAIGIAGVLYLWGIPMAAALIAARVPVSWEERLGEAVVNHLALPEKRCTDPARTRRIDEIVKSLLGPLPKLPYTFRIIVVDDPTLNAFAAPGGYIVLFRGLLEKSQSPEELAGVLAHELQHILQRHATQTLLRHASTGLLLSAIMGDISGTSAYGLEAARTLGTLRYSRSNEEEADAGGLRMLFQAGIDPAGMISFFETMKMESGGEPELLSYLSTHPSIEERVERLRPLVAALPKSPIKLLRDYDWKDIRKICPVTERSTKEGPGR
ncbi:MAG: M48 family metallopeptidase [Candidatus Binatota bacterium]